MSSQPAITPLRVAQTVALPNPYRGGVALWNRRDLSDMLGRKKTSHVIRTIELAVSLGYIFKIHSHDGVRECWVYATRPPLF